MQRIANPSTPVRFRPEPPFPLLIIVSGHCKAPQASCGTVFSLDSSLASQAGYRLFDRAYWLNSRAREKPCDQSFSVKSRWAPLISVVRPMGVAVTRFACMLVR